MQVYTTHCSFPALPAFTHCLMLMADPGLNSALSQLPTLSYFPALLRCSETDRSLKHFRTSKCNSYCSVWEDYAQAKTSYTGSALPRRCTAVVTTRDYELHSAVTPTTTPLAKAPTSQLAHNNSMSVVARASSRGLSLRSIVTLPLAIVKPELLYQLPLLGCMLKCRLQCRHACQRPWTDITII